MTSDEITGWVATLSAAADAEQRGRQARMAGAGGSGSLGGSGSGSPRGSRGGPAAGFGMASWRGDEVQSTKTGKGPPRMGAVGGGGARRGVGGGSGGVGSSPRLIAQGYAPAVVKLISFASGTTRATATADYVLREDAPLETHKGLILADREAVAAEMKRWAFDFEQRAKSQDAASVRVAVAGLKDTPEDRAKLQETVGVVFRGHVHAMRIDAVRDGSIEARVVAVLAGRNEEGKAERLRIVEQRIGSVDDGFSVRVFDAKSQAAIHARVDATGIAPYRLFVEPGVPAHGLDGLTHRLHQLSDYGVAVRSDGGFVGNAVEVRATAQAWKDQLRSQTPRDTMHLIISSKAGVDHERFRNAAREFLHGQFGDHKFMFALHTDRETDGHIHAHAIVAVRDENGVKIHPNRQTFAGWRAEFAMAAQAHGLKIAATGAMERASSQSYGPRDKAIVDAADRPRPGREDRDIAYAERPANAAMIANARRRIETARTNPVRIPITERQRQVVNASLGAWSQMAEQEPQNAIALGMTERLSLSFAAGQVLSTVEQTTKGYQKEDSAMAITAARMTSDLQTLNKLVNTVAEKLPPESRLAFTERSAEYLEIMAGRLDLQRQKEQGVQSISPDAVVSLAGTAANRLVQEARAVAAKEAREAEQARAALVDQQTGRNSDPARTAAESLSDRAINQRVEGELQDRAARERAQAVEAARATRQIEAKPTQAIPTDGNSPEAIRELRERQEQVRKDIEREQDVAKQKDGPARTKPQS
ncbi:MAG: relaxase/mobilization nuclease domain-containing protein [Bosea sp. (in: a-proteobacteria)]